jgi:hypothetical protein
MRNFLAGWMPTYLYTIKIALLFRMYNPSRIAWRNWRFGLFILQIVEWTFNLLYAFGTDMRVYLGCFTAFMSQ